MKTRLIAAAWLLFSTSVLTFAASRDAPWKDLDDAINKGLPKTAIEKLDPIIQGALKEKAWGEATKAIARKIVLEGNIQGNKPEEKITRLNAEIARAPKEIVPLLETIRANWHWQYFLQNRWRFMQRTQTAQPAGKDFTTWDLPRLFAEIDSQFQNALAGANTLKKTPVSVFDDLLVKGALPDTYRPLSSTPAASRRRRRRRMRLSCRPTRRRMASFRCLARRRNSSRERSSDGLANRPRKRRSLSSAIY